MLIDSLGKDTQACSHTVVLFLDPQDRHLPQGSSKVALFCLKKRQAGSICCAILQKTFFWLSLVVFQVKTCFKPAASVLLQQKIYLTYTKPVLDTCRTKIYPPQKCFKKPFRCGWCKNTRHRSSAAHLSSSWRQGVGGGSVRARRNMDSGSEHSLRDFNTADRWRVIDGADFTRCCC